MKSPATYKYFLFLFLAGILSINAAAQSDTAGAYRFNLIDLSKISVSSVSKTSRKYRMAPATIRVITSYEIKENGYFTLEQVLENLPGFQFRNIQGFNSYVFQRGIPSQNNLILVLINGIQANELNSGGFYGGAQYNLDNVERIEVVYGPVSVIYGTNAISGVINIITKDNKGISGSVLTGGFNTFGANLNAGIQKRKLKFTASGMYKTGKKADLAGTAGDNNWSSRMENFEHDYAFDAGISYSDFSAGVNFMNKQASRTTNYKSIGSGYQDFGTLWNIDFVNAYLKYAHLFTNSLKFISKLYNRNTTVEPNTIGLIKDSVQTAYYRPNYLLGLETILSWSGESNFEIVGGIQLESEKLAKGFSKTYSQSLTKPPPKPPKPEMLQNNLISLFAEANYTFLTFLTLTGGMRFDRSSYYGEVITSRLALIFDNNKLNMKLLYSDGFRAPRPWDYTSGTGNQDIKPEKMRSYEFSSAYYFHRNFYVDLSVYNNVLTGAFVKEEVDTNHNYHWINSGKIETNGIELGATYMRRHWQLYFNYTYNNSFDETGEPIAEIAKHSANTCFSYRFTKLGIFNLRLNYFGKRKNPVFINATNSNYINPALIVNGSFMLSSFKNVYIQLIVNNIFNTKYYHTSNRPPERYRQPQRNFMLKFSYKFTK